MKRLARIAQWFGVGRSVCLLLLVALVALRVWDPVPLEAVRLRTFDYYQLLQPRAVTVRPVVIVDIDEASLEAIGQWPWPRTVLADLVDNLTALGSVAIAFDVIFAEPDRMSPAVAAAAFRDLDEATREKLRRLPSNDQVFADALRRSRVVVGQSGLHVVPPGATDRAPATAGIATMGPDPRPHLVTFPGLLRNVPALDQAAAGRGLLTIRAERDGIVRRAPLVMQAQGAIVPALTIEMLRVVSGAGAVIIRSDAGGVRSVALPGLDVPTDRNGQLWIHFSPHDPDRYVAAKDVLEGKVAREKIAGKLVLVGTSAVGLHDVKTTPVDPAMSGVEVHAQVLETALTGAVLSYPNYAPVIELCIAIAVSLAIIVLGPILGALTLLALGAVVAAALVGISWYYFSRAGLLLDFTFPLLSSFGIYLTLVFINYFREQVGRRRIRSAFSQYLAPSLVEQLAHSRERLALGGEEREMTVMFSDVRGFTSISELYKDDPQGLTHLMNRLLTPLTHAIINHNGTIDKYIGDAIMAFWNAPLYDPAHELNACAAALEMLVRVEKLNRERADEAKLNGHRFVPLHIGVGLNTGRCVVGNMGSDLRFNYSVLGDTVNLASRLEGQTKAYGVPIIAGSRTALSAKDRYAIFELDFITVKGKREPEIVYTILGGSDVAADRRFRELRDLTTALLASYRRRDWGGALEAVRQCQAAEHRFGLDRFFDLYRERIHRFQQDPPPPDWNGVYALHEK